ncbi:MAG TPA: PepSY-like domain-containing protein [Flavisolibacter sp.]
MKLKLLFMIAAASLLFSCGTTTRTSTGQYEAYGVPAVIETSFTTQYPNATDVVWSRYDLVAVPIDWELVGWPAMEADDFVVQFNMDNEKYYAWYDSGGEWIGSAYVVADPSTLPAPVTTAVNNRYAGYTIESVQREFWKDQMAYEIKLKQGDTKVKMLVDANGNVLKEKTKVDD